MAVLLVEHRSANKRHGGMSRGKRTAVRAIGSYTEDLYGLVTVIGNELRSRFRGQGPLHLRKY